jgi:hypothetical protein
METFYCATSEQIITALNNIILNNTYINPNLMTEAQIIEVLQQGCCCLKKIENQTYSIVLEAVGLNGMDLQFLDPNLVLTPEQYYNIALEAVTQNGLALQHIIRSNLSIDLYHIICLTAIRQNGLALQYCLYPTIEEITEAVTQNGLALQFFREFQTDDICLIAIRQNGRALQFVKIQTPSLCIEAIQQNSSSFIFIKEPILGLIINELSL